MTTGIYKLTFPSGREYIGKSTDIERRWKQHIDKFYKGTAAKELQEEYNNYGMPDFEVILECHADHIDIIETYYISEGTNLLNTSKPVPISEQEFEILTRDLSLLDKSTVEHVDLINNLTEELGEFIYGNGIENVYYENITMKEDLSELKDAYTDLEVKVKELQMLLNIEKSKSWWTKLFE